MAGTIWSKFFWSDWANDPSLRLCSLAAQGMWMRCLCIAAEADPTGYVTVNGRPLDGQDLARMAGASVPEAETLLSELERNGVFSRDRSGRIYSRRMVRDTKQRQVLVRNGREGGNPNIRRGTVPKAERVRPYKRSDSPAKTLRIFEKGGGKCHWCGVELVWDGDLQPNLFHVDHIIAVSDGGRNDEDNLVSACAKCNHARARTDWEKPVRHQPDSNGVTKPHKPYASTPEEESTPTGVPKKRRGSRIPDDWLPSASDERFAVEAGLSRERIRSLAAEFRDYWRAAPRGVKLDWSATWRNRVRQVLERNSTVAPVLPLRSFR